MTLRPYWYCYCLALMLVSELSLSAPKVDEGRIKAVVAYKITHFVVWPEKPSILKICTLGSSELSEMLDGIVKQAGKDSKFNVNHQNLGVDYKNNCDALYIRNLDERDTKSVLRNLKEWPVLTIGDSEEFARDGGMVGLYTEDDKVRFAVNINAVKDAGLLVKSQLLSLAKVIQ
ncbi:YfiR family protein [Endozoicomonas sp.]|uniref:YfiR family protein n=1 Tax=Endozoicomonas sp. TaxID=1892382 RepID=UPI003AF655D1